MTTRRDQKRSPARRRPAGYTLIEMMVVVAILGIIATLGWVSVRNLRPRARLTSTALEIQATIQAARKQAMSHGRDVLVMVFPDATAGASTGTGRVVVVLDQDGGFAAGTGNAPTFCDWQVGTPGFGAARKGEILSTVEFPSGVVAQPPLTPVTLAYPYNAVGTITLDCSFCGGTGAARKGAIRFNSQGRADVLPACGTPVPLTTGAYLSLVSSELGDSRAIVMTPYGSVRVFNAD